MAICAWKNWTKKATPRDFYGAQYLSDRQRHAASFQRAVIYLNRTLDNGKPEVAARVRSALGLLYIWESEKETDPKKKKYRLGQAKLHVFAVLAANGLTASCPIAAASMDRREDRIANAIDRLDSLIRAAAEHKLPTHELKQSLWRAYFNRACYRTLSGNAEGAVEDLWESRGAAEKYNLKEKWIKKLKEECGAGGDFEQLCASLPEQFAQMRDPNYRAIR